MKRYAVLLLLGLWLMPAAVLARGQNDALVIGAGQHVAGSVATIAQDIQVDGMVDGDVTSWSGAITIAGSVGGDVVSYNGDVTLTPTGRVGGHILASGGTLHREQGALVAGQAITGGTGEALASLIDLLNPTSAGRQDDALARALFGIALAVLLMAFCFLYTAFWPGRVALAGDVLRRLPGRALGLGLLTTLTLALALLPLAGLLVASVVGIPVLLALLALGLALYVYGLVVLTRTLSASGILKAQSVDRLATSRMIALSLAVVLLIALAVALAPLWGLALFFLVASPGLGAVLLSRGGMALPITAR
ncbi:MAG TPA: polymer-forming cytoskeletal protein [Roseiflexaceae bacterium]|nr:polymer-forming cytoskeletal protein [Roseiflexaceae bacterium]